jgi:hypothetical protein
LPTFYHKLRMSYSYFIQDDMFMVANTPLYGRLSRKEKRAITLRFSGSILAKEDSFVRDVLTDALCITVCLTCESEACLEGPDVASSQIPVCPESVPCAGASTASTLSVIALAEMPTKAPRKPRLPFMQVRTFVLTAPSYLGSRSCAFSNSIVPVLMCRKSSLSLTRRCWVVQAVHLI